MLLVLGLPFPRRLGFDARSDPEWSTELAATAAGFEATNQMWSKARHAFDVSFSVRTRDDYMQIRAHFHAMRGRAKGFLFRDPLDYQATATEGVTSVLDGSPTAWGLAKRYGSGTDAYDRRITRPTLGTVVIWRKRGMTTTDVTSACVIDYGGPSTDEPGGQFYVSGHQSGDVYTWAGEFLVPCRYDVDRLPGLIVDRNPGAGGQLLVQCESIPLVEVRE